jgi:hypothetical protein
MAQSAATVHQISVRRSCVIFGVSQTCYHYAAKNKDENKAVADSLIALSLRNRARGFGLMFLHLRNVQGKRWNHKRVYRVYCELKFNLRIKSHQRVVRVKPEPLATSYGVRPPARTALCHKRPTVACAFCCPPCLRPASRGQKSVRCQCLAA